MLQGLCQSRRAKQKYIFPTFSNYFFPSLKKSYFSSQQIIYPLKQVGICDYNPICLMSSGLMFDEIIINIFRNKADN